MSDANTENLINQRCFWCSKDAMYTDYHDNEWGVPTHDDVRLFEKICLEGLADSAPKCNIKFSR